MPSHVDWLVSMYELQNRVVSDQHRKGHHHPEYYPVKNETERSRSVSMYTLHSTDARERKGGRESLRCAQDIRMQSVLFSVDEGRDRLWQRCLFGRMKEEGFCEWRV